MVGDKLSPFPSPLIVSYVHGNCEMFMMICNSPFSFISVPYHVFHTTFTPTTSQLILSVLSSFVNLFLSVCHSGPCCL